MSVVQTHFWLFCGLWVGGGGSIAIYYSLERHVISKEISNIERSVYIYGWLAAVLTPCLLLWLIGLTVPNGNSVAIDSFPGPQRFLSELVEIGSKMAVAGWVWFKGGARILVRLIQLLRAGSSPYPDSVYFPKSWVSESSIKACAVLILLVGLVL